MSNKVYVFIDAANLWQTQKVKNKFFDFKKLTKYLIAEHKADELKTFYYTAYPAEGTRNYSLDGRHKFYTYLKKGLGITVCKKPLKRIATEDKTGSGFEEKGNMDVEMAIDAVRFIEKYDTAILFSGDSDFVSLVHYIQINGKRVYVYSTNNHMSYELRISADKYFDVLKVDSDIWGADVNHRAQKEKNEKRPSIRESS